MDYSPEYADMQETICWPENKTGYRRIKRRDIQSYITDDFLTVFQTYGRIKNYGWPQGCGYLAEPRAVFDIVELFDREKAAYLKWKKDDGGNK